MSSASRRKSSSRGGGGGGRKGSRKSTSSNKEPRNKKQKAAASDPPEYVADNKEFFTVAKIVDSKMGKNGKKLYRTRWEGYKPDDDTWEPLAHIAGTGHVDRYERKLRERTLSTYTPGVAVIEYDDGERQTIDLRQEKFREWRDDMDEDLRSDEDEDGNNFNLIQSGVKLELLWPYAQIYFSCTVISWTPLLLNHGNNITVDSPVAARHGSMVWAQKEKNPESDVYKTIISLEGASVKQKLKGVHQKGRTKPAVSKQTMESEYKKGSSAGQRLKGVDQPDKRVTDASKQAAKQKPVENDTNEGAKKSLPIKQKEEGEIPKNTTVAKTTEESSRKRKRPDENESEVENINSDEMPSKKMSRQMNDESTHDDSKMSTKLPCGNDSDIDMKTVLAKEATEKKGALAAHEGRPDEKEGEVEKINSDKMPGKQSCTQMDKESTKLPFNNNSDTVTKTVPTKEATEKKEFVAGPVEAGPVEAVPVDDRKDAVSKILHKRNVSEEISVSQLFGEDNRKQSATATSNLSELNGSTVDAMDIDALAVAVASKRSHPMHTTKSMKKVKYDVDYESEVEYGDCDHSPSKQKIDSEDESSLIDALAVEVASKRSHPIHMATKSAADFFDIDYGNNSVPKPKGSGVPLYPASSSEDEGRNLRDIFQRSSNPRREGPEPSLEELWMMKLHRTQMMMDNNNNGSN